MKYLYLNSNEISDISALSSLTQLEYLDLSNNEILDFSALDGLHIEALNVEGNKVKEKVKEKQQFQKNLF